MNAAAAPPMVVTDLDGTLLDSSSELSNANRECLEELGRRGCIRVVATGRSLYAARKALSADFPIDFLIFSTGTGVLDWASGELLFRRSMPGETARAVAGLLFESGCDFMVHHAVPDTHCFHFCRQSASNEDFDRRLSRYRTHARAFSPEAIAGIEVSQLLVIEPPERISVRETAERGVAGINVVRTTSPLDHRSRWIEIFPLGVSKAETADWLRRRLGVTHAQTHAIGNDYNDTDMLEWAARASVVANGVDALKDSFEVVASNDEQGFAVAVAQWFGAPSGSASLPGRRGGSA